MMMLTMIMMKKMVVVVKYSQKVREDLYHTDNNSQLCWL